MVEVEEPAKVTASHLRDADSRCALRLRHEHDGLHGNRGATARWVLEGRLRQDLALAHATLRTATAHDLRPGEDLLPEQARVYEAAARWYLAIFGAVAVRDVGLDDFETPVPRLDVRLVGPAGWAVEHADGRRELRILRLGGRRDDQPLLDRAFVRFALLRRAAWWHPAPLRVVVADLVRGELDEVDVLPTVLAELDAWLDDRVARIRERIADPQPRRTTQCAWCAFLAQCPAMRSSR